MRAPSGLLHKDLSNKIIRAFYDVYDELGFGFLESAYKNSMPIALGDMGLSCRVEVATDVKFRGKKVGDFRTDLIVEEKVIVETKVATKLNDAHEHQILNYLRATNLEVGLLLNFGPTPQFKRYVLTSR